MTAWQCFIETRDGQFSAWFTAAGLTRLDFPRDQVGTNSTPSQLFQRKTGTEWNRSLPDRKDGSWVGSPTKETRSWQSVTARAVEDALLGRRPPALPPFDWSDATGFQRRVWTLLLGIAPGRTRSYGEIASALGRPKAARAVGAACGANPIPLLVPCHRVLAAGGALGGFSGGLRWKQLLLGREGVILR